MHVQCVTDLEAGLAVFKARRPVVSKWVDQVLNGLAGFKMGQHWESGHNIHTPTLNICMSTELLQTPYLVE